MSKNADFWRVVSLAVRRPWGKVWLDTALTVARERLHDERARVLLDQVFDVIHVDDDQGDD